MRGRRRDREPIHLGKFTVTPIESKHFQFPDPEMAARETVEQTNPSRVIPIHWDSLTGPIDGPFTGPVRAAAFFTKGSDNTLTFLKDKAVANPNIELVTLPRYDPVVLF